MTILAASGALALAAPAAASAAPALAPSMRPRGIDVSSYQHPSSVPIDWKTVHANGESFALIKATEGTTYTNPYFAADWAGARAAGMARGAYHFARPSYSLSSAVAQANHFLRVTGPMQRAGALPAVLDLEQSGGLSPSRLISWTRTWLNTVRRATGRKPMIYTYYYFWVDNMANTTHFSSYPLWMADYNGGSSPRLIGGWSTWAFWQTSANGSAPGVRGGALDMDVANGSLSRYTWGGTGVSAHPTLRQGSRGAAVKTLQRKVHVSADGDFGPATRAAVLRFQRAHHLTADGIVGPATWAAIAGTSGSQAAHAKRPRHKPKPSPKHHAAAHPTLRRGSRGAGVKTVQRKVHVRADGDFGPATRAAVLRFQRAHHLTADGIVGPATWAALT